jgi:hypothetical protein
MLWDDWCPMSHTSIIYKLLESLFVISFISISNLNVKRRIGLGFGFLNSTFNLFQFYHGSQIFYILGYLVLGLWTMLLMSVYVLYDITFRPSSVIRPSTFHILIFSSETTGPIATKLW